MFVRVVALCDYHDIMDEGATTPTNIVKVYWLVIHVIASMLAIKASAR